MIFVTAHELLIYLAYATSTTALKVLSPNVAKYGMLSIHSEKVKRTHYSGTTWHLLWLINECMHRCNLVSRFFELAPCRMQLAALSKRKRNGRGSRRSKVNGNLHWKLAIFSPDIFPIKVSDGWVRIGSECHQSFWWMGTGVVIQSDTNRRRVEIYFDLNSG